MYYNDLDQSTWVSQSLRVLSLNWLAHFIQFVGSPAFPADLDQETGLIPKEMVGTWPLFACL
jgi:hypothetical protein